MKIDQPIPALPPDAIGDYRISRTLAADRTYLALAPGDREVVIKMMDRDCLLRGQLHPSIKERLARVRELAHRGVANLFGVERCDGHVFAVWEHVSGKTVDQHAGNLASVAELSALGREIILTVEALHSLGIVHGRLHAGNIIVDDFGQVRLTHISPLLYDDPNNDLHDLISLLRELFAKHGWGDLPVVGAIAEAKSLSQLRMKLTTTNGLPEEVGVHPRRDSKPRNRALIAAAIAAVAGLVIAFGVLRGVGKAAREKVTPPEAPAQAMEAGRK